MSAPATACSSAVFQVPTLSPGQSITYCAVDTFGNHTEVLQSCCSQNNGKITTSGDGCNVFCDITAAILDSTQSCLENSKTPAFCGHSNISGPAFPSPMSSTATATNSAASPSSSDSPRRSTPISIAVGIVLMLALSMI